MKRSEFKIEKMDCPSEESLIRMKLSDVKGIHSLNFNIKDRSLSIDHLSDDKQLSTLLAALNLDSRLLQTIEISNDEIVPLQKTERKSLVIVLLINFFLFVVEFITGILSDSMGLIADSLDMFADAIVYGLSLLVVGGHLIAKRRVAKVSGYLQLLLAVAGFSEVIRRFFGIAEIPHFETMVYISLLALIGNALSLYILQKQKSKEVHMQASIIFTSNDVIVNIGVIIAAVLVYYFETAFPDLLIGAIVFFLVTRGAIRILKL